MNWRKTRPRIFTYLRPWIPGIEDLLLALQATGTNVICAFPGAPAPLIQYFQTPFMHIFPAAVSIEPLLPTTDLVTGYGSGLVATSLLAGVPLLLVPYWSEHYLTAKRIETIGAGLVASQKNTQLSYSATISALLSNPKFRIAAQQFATKYNSFSNEKAVNEIIEVIHLTILRNKYNITHPKTYRH